MPKTLMLSLRLYCCSRSISKFCYCTRALRAIMSASMECRAPTINTFLPQFFKAKNIIINKHTTGATVSWVTNYRVEASVNYCYGRKPCWEQVACISAFGKLQKGNALHVIAMYIKKASVQEPMVAIFFKGSSFRCHEEDSAPASNTTE